MIITVAICTWNRAKLLDQTLAEMRNLHIPQGIEWELLVVNNNCTDDTDIVIAGHSTTLPLRRIFEPTQGQTFARNRAFDEATGEWVLFTDDDVLVDPHLLEAYAEAIRSRGEQVTFMGGEIKPWFVEQPDQALAEALPTVSKGFCGIDVLEDKWITKPEDGTPHGANMLFSKIRVEGERFNTRMGYSGRSMISGEEIEYCRRLLAKGHRGAWVKKATLRHYVSPDRLTLSYLRRHLFDAGRGGVRTKGVPMGRRIFGPPAWLWKATVTYGLQAIWHWPRKSRYQFYYAYGRFFSLCRFSF